jgi:hemoglobin
VTRKDQRASLPDLDTRSQVHDAVVRFYREIVFDDVLGPVFEEVAEVDWSVHIPKLIDFWCRVLLGEPGYDGYLLHAHAAVHDMETFRPEFFERWLRLFIETVDDGWEGPFADKAKAHARHVAAVLARRLGVGWVPEAAPVTFVGAAPARVSGDDQPSLAG